MNNLKIADYIGFAALDFFKDEHYIRYVLHPLESEADFWSGLEQQHPELSNALEEAKAWILLLNTQPLYKPNRQTAESWEQISEKMRRHDRVQSTYIIPLKRSVKWLSGVAAVFLVYFAVIEFMQLGRQSFRSEYGELRNVNFPDESVATLNANSRIYYNRDWRSDKPREMWLEGEASFKVKHVAVRNRFQEADSFKVHVNGLELTVLGTQFNVKDRRGETEIALIEGSLRIDKKDGTAFTQIMKPGDVYRYDGRQLVKIRQRTTKAIQSWIRKELELEGGTLQDVLHVLEDSYGYRITMNAPHLLNRRLSGTIPLTSGRDIIFVMEKVFDIEVVQRNQELIINKRR
ncbi:FecR family protein [Pedobacter sp. GR22-6]|uniref:FecR family protein n=1 Tax=Pedobacter sp. GR22-6 TaxID=3127957 RepID=UPI00307EEA27